MHVFRGWRSQQRKLEVHLGLGGQRGRTSEEEVVLPLGPEVSVRAGT